MLQALPYLADNSLVRWLPYLHYPAVVTATFVLFVCLQSWGASLVVSTYVPILLAAAMVTLLELKFPHRAEWRRVLDEMGRARRATLQAYRAEPKPPRRKKAAKRPIARVR